MKKKVFKAQPKRHPGVALQPVVRRRYAISEERILQISNDISEDMCNARASDLIEVVKYFRDNFDAVWQARQSERTQLALDLLDMAHPLLNPKPPERLR